MKLNDGNWNAGEAKEVTDSPKQYITVLWE